MVCRNRPSETLLCTDLFSFLKGRSLFSSVGSVEILVFRSLMLVGRLLSFCCVFSLKRPQSSKQATLLAA